MQETDKLKFLNLLTGVCSVYGKTMNEPLLEIYWQALARFEFDAVNRAFNSHVNNPDKGQFMPKPADVVEFLEGTKQTQSLQAWTKVLTAIKNIGAYPSLVFDDAIIHAAIEEMGGWIELCRVSTEQLQFRAQEFSKRYAAHVMQPPISYPKKIIGLIEQTNQGAGYKIEPPVLVGDQQKALQVFERGCDASIAFHRSKLSIGETVKNLPVSADEGKTQNKAFFGVEKV